MNRPTNNFVQATANKCVKNKYVTVLSKLCDKWFLWLNIKTKGKHTLDVILISDAGSAVPA